MELLSPSLSHYSTLSSLLAFGVGFLLLRILQTHIYSPLKKFPGPFLGSLTDWWRLVYSYRILHSSQPWIDIHRKYGDIVRLGPDMLSFGSAEAARDIYGAGKNFKKSEFYSTISPVEKGVIGETVFSTRDQHYHQSYRRAVNSAFSLSSLLRYEGLMDEMGELLISKLRAKVKAGEKSIDMPRWFQNYAFDTVASMCYSKPYGFLEQDVDIDNIVSTTRMILDYTSHFGNVPFFDWLVLKNPIMLWLGRKGWVELTTPLVPWAVKYQAERVQQWKENAELGKPQTQNDMLDTYIGLHHAKPDVIGPHHVTELGLMVGFAGSESTSSALGALTYLVISHRKVYDKLVAEVRDPSNFPLGTTTISYAAASKLPYFDACVKEMFRLHPPGGAIMERVVPPGGAHIAGHDIPAGTIVGCNARPVQRDPKVFGPDPDAFRPERWLAGEDASDAEKQKVNEMWAAMLHFGAGKHTCMGKNISLLEIYKIAVALFREFEMELDQSFGPAKWTYSQFVRVEFRAILKVRS